MELISHHDHKAYLKQFHLLIIVDFHEKKLKKFQLMPEIGVKL